MSVAPPVPSAGGIDTYNIDHGFVEAVVRGFRSSFLLSDDYDNLSKKLDNFQNQEKIEKQKQIEFSEKIDELNQETDSLLEEIDKWQT